MEKISIIISAYNGEKYIVKYVESILNQSYKNLEIIIINDESKDNTINILSYYKGLNSKIRVIDKQNEGVSSARNYGIKISSGDYIIFVDADDTLEPNAVEVLLELIINGNVELAIASNNVFRRKCINRKNILIDKLYDKKEIVEKITQCNIFFSTPWGKLFDTNIVKILKGLRFDRLDIYVSVFMMVCIGYGINSIFEGLTLIGPGVMCYFMLFMYGILYARKIPCNR